MPTRSKKDRYIAITRPLKTAEDFCSASAAVAGAMQVHAYAGSVSRNQVPTSHIKNAILVCPINIFLSATDGQHQCEVWRRVCTIQVRPIMTLLSFAGFKVKMRPRLFPLVRKRQNSNKIYLTLMTPFALVVQPTASPRRRRQRQDQIAHGQSVSDLALPFISTWHPIEERSKKTHPLHDQKHLAGRHTVTDRRKALTLFPFLPRFQMARRCPTCNPTFVLNEPLAY
jgi:hypothetical protein